MQSIKLLPNKCTQKCVIFIICCLSTPEHDACHEVVVIIDTMTTEYIIFTLQVGKNDNSFVKLYPSGYLFIHSITHSNKIKYSEIKQNLSH